MSLLRIAPEVPVSSLPAALEYYEQKLGFRTVMLMPGGDYAIVERDAIAIHLFKDDTVANVPVSMHIFTSQLDGLHTELQARGARLSQEIMRKPWGNRDFRVLDPSGNVIKFTEPIAGDD